MFINTHKMN